MSTLLSVIAASRRRSGLDADVAAFISATGATDTTGINNLVTYLKAQGLWNDVRFFPFKSAQNHGSGTAVRGLGGWTSNNITLVNGPTWGAAGVTFDAVNDRGEVTMTGLPSLHELFIFDRQNPSSASSPDTQRWGVFYAGDQSTNRGIFVNSNTGAVSGETFVIADDATVADVRRAGTTAAAWTAGASTQMVARFSQTGFGIWQSKTSRAITLTSGTQDFRPSQAGIATSLVHLNAFCNLSGPTYSGFTATTRVCLLLCKTTLTTPQREAITDYLDAL